MIINGIHHGVSAVLSTVQYKLKLLSEKPTCKGGIVTLKGKEYKNINRFCLKDLENCTC